jgi:uncharacterized damage-inducible protein DinB
MHAVDLVRRLHQHRGWVNRQLLDAAGSLSDEQLRRSFPIGQGSIWKSLLHLWAAEYVWLDALLGKEQSLAPGDVAGKLPGNQEGEAAMSELAVLETKWNQLDARWQQYLQQLTSDGLDDVVYKHRSSGGRYAFRRADILLHVCTHAHYTVAQIVNMLRHAGADPLPDPMLITLARGEAPIG